MNYDMFILRPEQQDQILSYEKSKLQGMDEAQKEFTAWKAPWRQESLEHYLPMGWSFGVAENGELKGYFLGQPLLFFKGLTQNLWVEHLSFDEPEAGKQLVDIAYKWSRDKHLQRLLVNVEEAAAPFLEDFKATALSEEKQIFSIKTSKIRM